MGTLIANDNAERTDITHNSRVRICESELLQLPAYVTLVSVRLTRSPKNLRCITSPSDRNLHVSVYNTTFCVSGVRVCFLR